MNSSLVASSNPVQKKTDDIDLSLDFGRPHAVRTLERGKLLPEDDFYLIGGNLPKRNGVLTSRTVEILKAHDPSILDGCDDPSDLFFSREIVRYQPLARLLFRLKDSDNVGDYMEPESYSELVILKLPYDAYTNNCYGTRSGRRGDDDIFVFHKQEYERVKLAQRAEQIPKQLKSLLYSDKSSDDKVDTLKMLFPPSGEIDFKAFLDNFSHLIGDDYEEARASFYENEKRMSESKKP